MPSGYEKSADCGPPTWRGIVLGVLAFAAIVAVLVYLAA